MNNVENIIVELEKLNQFLYGAHMGTDNIEFSETSHHACHRVDDIINLIKSDNGLLVLTL